MLGKNTLTLTGMVSSMIKSHDFQGENFFRVEIEVARLSENVDILPVIVSEKLLYNNQIAVGQLVTIVGQVRTKNHKEEDETRSKLLVFGYVKDLAGISEDDLFAIDIKNKVEIVGYICKPPIHRVTPLEWVITDLHVACNRQYGKSDHVPCVAWGTNAKMARNLKVGDKVKLTGRFQSRNYFRKSDDDNTKNTTYEVSISQLEVMAEDVVDIAGKVVRAVNKEAKGLAKNMHKNTGIKYLEAM